MAYKVLFAPYVIALLASSLAPACSWSCTLLLIFPQSYINLYQYMNLKIEVHTKLCLWICMRHIWVERLKNSSKRSFPYFRGELKQMFKPNSLLPNCVLEVQNRNFRSAPPNHGGRRRGLRSLFAHPLDHPDRGWSRRRKSSNSESQF